MINKTIHTIHLVSSLAFFLGVISTAIFWLNNSIDLGSYILNNLVVMVCYFIGGVAIIVPFVSIKSNVKKQEFDTAKKEEQETNLTVKEESDSLLDYSIISQEMDRVYAVEGDNKFKSERLLSVLCNGLKAGQGALFVLVQEGSIQKLKSLASYAFVHEKSVEEGFEMNDGLLGLAVKEDRKIELTDIPKENIKIFSGLGQSKPSSVVIFPIKNNGEMKGVLELSFMTKHNKGIHRFINENMEKIGALL